MNRKRLILFSGLLAVLAGFTCQAQEKSKTYKETYNVDKDTELNINTSYADIEFVTWDKDQVEITAIVELDGVPDEDAKSYFDQDLVKIMGNSKEIEVSTEGAGPYAFDFRSIDINIPEIPSVAHIMENIDIPEMPEIAVLPELAIMPPLPPIPHMDFDYDAYRKDGDKYMKEWKKKFDKNFDEDYKKHFEEWSKEMKEMAKAREEQMAELKKQREEMRIDRERMRQEMREELQTQREELRNQREEARRQQMEEARAVRISPNVFYFSSDGKNKEYKVKKHIIIKMPKYLKLNLNVRHGEVKLAANTRNINASLSYASLLASTIDGDKTEIRASYTPVVVQRWNYGTLRTNYSDDVSLKEVKELKLNSVSSNVVIGNLTSKASMTNNFGNLSINSVSDGFHTLDISVENGELDCKLPATSFVISVNETTSGSGFKYPQALKLQSSKSHGSNLYKGYHINNTEGKSINIRSKYSEVVLKNE